MVLPGIYHEVLLSFGLLTIAPSHLLSQHPDSSALSQQAELRERLEMLKLSSRLRIRTDTQRREGQLISRTADSLGLRDAEGETHVPMLAVDSLWVRRHHTKTGFLIGALVGAGVYVFITSYEDSEYPELDNAIGAVLWAGSVALGSIVGAITASWRRVYP